MASEVGIANSAFRKVGVRGTITSFDQGTPAANFASDRYAELRDEMLRGHPWNFGKRRVKLAKLSTGPTVPNGWNYFQLPADWLRTINVYDNDAGVGTLEWYHEDDKRISAGREEIWCDYVYQVTDPNAMPPDFREALAYAMAVEVAIDLVGSRTLSDTMAERGAEKLLVAKGNDSQGDGPRRLPVGSWVRNRFRGVDRVVSSS